ncbi:MAG: hypothetical protein GY854_30180 [Deltaproteobacteria bacterium]|nr:hypothetical protein [Deltaproteobacteria bacterium]
MFLESKRWKTVLLCICTFAVWPLAQTACTEGDDKQSPGGENTNDTENGGDSDSDADGDGDSACEPGATQECVCLGGNGVQSCKDDGSGWKECLCGGGGDSDGDADGDADGDSDGDSDGDADGDSDGDADGDSDGDADGDSDGDSDGDADGDSDGDADGDSDGDADGDADQCSPIQWGAGAQKGQSIGNWQLTGFADTDSDHLVEKVSTLITMEDIHCSGAKSLVISIGDSS